MANKKYKSKRELTYPLLGGKQPKIDTTVEYRIVGYAKACGGRPVIERVDGNEFLGSTRWIVDEIDLVEAQ